MKNEMNSSEKPQKFQFVLGKIIKSIGIILASVAGLIIAFSIWLTVHLNFVRRDCFLAEWICDVSEALNAPECFHVVAVADRFGMSDWWGVTKPEHERTAAEQTCIEQQNHLHSRCYLPHFINKQYEKYQAKQRGEEFYGDVKDCKDIEIQGDGEKK